MGDLKKFLNESNEPGFIQPERRIRYRRWWWNLLPILAGALWIYIAWRQVDKAQLEKERISGEIDSLIMLRDRMERGLPIEVASSSPAPKTRSGHANANRTAAVGEPAIPQFPAAAETGVENDKENVPAGVTVMETPAPADPSGQPAPAVYEEESPFLIVAGAAKTLEGARVDVERLRRTGIDLATIYFRDEQFRVIAGPFPRGQTNTQLDKIKEKVNQSAYLVRAERWCSATVRREGYLECR